VEYDNSKVNSEQGNLGARKYILPNILEYGGICGDQAHFCSRTAKCLGVPAMKASGLSRYGGAGHAFTLFFVWKKGRLHLESTGRYYFDYYYTGNVFDPQTRTEILDRHLGLILDGASLSYNKFITAHALSRIASKVYSNHPDASLALVKKALALNWFCGAGWKLLMRHIEDGHMEPREGTQWANKMMKYVKDHPDLTLNCFTTFLGCIPREDTKKRQSFYQQAFKSYKKRPDLQIDLRIAQGKELIGSGEEETALAIFLDTAAEHAKTGRIMLPLLEEAVKIVNEKNEYHLAFQAFDKILKKYPRKRGASIAKSFQDLARLLIPVYKAGDREKDAYFLRMEAELYD
jgi:tetratricopeptide (TPR) repeat protein